MPNHAPLVIAEQFGTLVSLFPNRIDLGLGRSPGTDQWTARALRRTLNGGESFPLDVMELQSYFRPAEAGQSVRAVPGAGLNVPIWLVGSSALQVEVYRAEFRPSAALERPYAMLGLNVFAADTDAEARRLFTSLQQFVNLRRGEPTPLQPPVDDLDARLLPWERKAVDEALSCSIIGSPETVRDGIERFVAQTDPDELMVTAQIYDHAARLRSFEVTAEVRDALASARRTTMRA